MIMKIFNQKANYINILKKAIKSQFLVLLSLYFKRAKMKLFKIEVVDHHLILSACNLFGKLTSFFELVFLCFCLAIDYHTLLDIFLTIRDSVLFSLILLSLSVFIGFLRSYCFSRLFFILICKDRRCSKAFSFFNIFLLILIQSKFFDHLF